MSDAVARKNDEVLAYAKGKMPANEGDWINPYRVSK